MTLQTLAMKDPDPGNPAFDVEDSPLCRGDAVADRADFPNKLT